MKLKKGSSAAKAFMAKIRAKKGKVGASTRSEVRSPTRTSTSTKALTSGNLTVTGGAGRGATTSVYVSKLPKKIGYNGLNSVEVIFKNAKYNYTTNVSASTTEQSAKKYFIGKSFNVGVFPVEKVEKCIGIRFNSGKIVSGFKKEKNMNEISPYKIYWNVLMPIKGKITKTDQVKINKFLGVKGINTKIYPYSYIDGILYTFSNKIDEYINKIQSNNPLTKSLISYKFTDKQFGMANNVKGDIKFGTRNYIVLTEKQKQESKFIK